jgi:CRP-like cAMP-binding protein
VQKKATMALSDDIRLLSGVPLFQGLDDDQLRLVAFGAERRSVAKGQELFREQSPAECAYVVARGRLDLYTLGRDAAEDGEVLRIPRTLFHRLLEEYPAVARILEQRIRDNLVGLAKAAAAMQGRFA